MTYYQARISYETAQLLEEMRLYYEKETKGAISKGECIDRAFFEAQKDVDWKQIYDTKITIKSHEISDSSKALKVHISDDTRLGIQKLKSELPAILGYRSITVGVCLREILKCAYLATQHHKVPNLVQYIENSEKELLATPPNKILETALSILKEIKSFNIN